MSIQTSMFGSTFVDEARDDFDLATSSSRTAFAEPEHPKPTTTTTPPPVTHPVTPDLTPPVTTGDHKPAPPVTTPPVSTTGETLTGTYSGQLGDATLKGTVKGDDGRSQLWS